MINKVNNQRPEIYKDAVAKQASCSRTCDNNQADASLQVSYEALLEQAKAQPVNDANVVERARHMLMSGELDNPENIRKAAENLLKFGV